MPDHKTEEDAKDSVPGADPEVNKTAGDKPADDKGGGPTWIEDANSEDI